MASHAPRRPHGQNDRPPVVIKAGELPAHRQRRLEEPPRVAIIGGGPAGLEAALYAQRLGMKVRLFESAPRVAPDVREWDHVTMFTPWGQNRSSLGELALRQTHGRQRGSAGWPADKLHPTGADYIRHYLEPLSRLIEESLCLDTRVVAVGRSYLFSDELRDDPGQRATRRFRLLTRSSLEERMYTADFVVDASGISHTPNWFGAGGVPALGEMGATRNVFYRIPDIAGKDRIHFLGKRTLLVGDGSSAATTAVLLSEIAVAEPSGSFVWACKSRAPVPIAVYAEDPLSRRDLLHKRANLLAAQKAPGIEVLAPAQVEAAQYSLADGRFHVTLQVDHETRRMVFDSIVANVGYRRDLPSYESLLAPCDQGLFVVGSRLPENESLIAGYYTQIRDVFREVLNDSAVDLYADAARAFGRGPEIQAVQTD